MSVSGSEQLHKWVLGAIKSASDADAGTRPATTGAHAAENAADIAAQVPGQSVNTAPEASDSPGVGGTSGTPASAHAGAAMSDTLPKTPAKTKADDPGTASAAKAAAFQTMAATKEAGLSILAALAVAREPVAPVAPAVEPAAVKVAEAAPAAVPAAEPVAAVPAVKQAEAAPEQLASARAAGVKAAELTMNALGIPATPEAALVHNIVKNAEFDADAVVDCLAGFAKAAGATEGMPAEGMPAEAMPPEAAQAAGGAEQQITPEQLMQLLDEAGVEPEELLAELVQSGQIPPEVAEQIMQEAQAAAEQMSAQGGAPAEGAPAPEAAPMAAPMPEAGVPAEAAVEGPAKGAEAKSVGSAELKAGTDAPQITGKPVKPADAPNAHDTTPMGGSKKSAAAATVLRAALRALEAKA